MTTANIKQTTLASTTEHSVSTYLMDLGEHEAFNVYRTVIDEVERPLLKVMMRYTEGNQSKAAKYLGINRATLRTKLKRYDML